MAVKGGEGEMRRVSGIEKGERFMHDMLLPAPLDTLGTYIPILLRNLLSTCDGAW